MTGACTMAVMPLLVAASPTVRPAMPVPTPIFSSSRRGGFRAVGAACAALGLGGCDRPPAGPPDASGGSAPAVENPARLTEWPLTRGGGDLSGRVACKVPRGPAVDWTFAAGAAVTSEAAMADGVVVFGDEDGNVHAVEFATRKELWLHKTEDTIEASPAIAGGRVFVGSNDGYFRALNLRDGKELWKIKGQEKFPTGAVIVSQPGVGEVVLVNGYDGSTRCLNPADGSERWTYPSADYINGSPAVLDGGLVAFGGCDAHVHVIRLTDGGLLRKIPTDAQIVRSMAGAGTWAYGINHADQLVAADTGTQALAWVYQNDDGQLLTSPGLDGQHVYVGSRDKHLHAVARSNGKPVWKFKTGGRVETPPLVFDDAVVIGSADGRLYAVDATGGDAVWRLDLGEAIAVAPVYAAERIIVGGNDGTLFVIRGGGGP